MWIKLIFVCLFLNLTKSHPIFPSVINGTQGAELHAVLLFVEGFLPGFGKLGGGTIISARHVLTAASVVHGASHVLIGYGGSSTDDLRIKKTELFVAHPEYRQLTGKNDIAIVFVSKKNAFVFDETVGKINLPPATITEPDVGVVATIAGYGFTGPDEYVASDTLLVAELEIVNNLRCELQFLVPLTTHFCAEPTDKRSNICTGDHGAGLFGIPTIEQPTTEPPTTEPPTKPPTDEPTKPPTDEPTKPPTDEPTKPPTDEPTEPTIDPPTDPPTKPPTDEPTKPPTDEPTKPPTDEPTKPPTEHPPTEAPPTEHPPTEAPPTEHPPTEHPPTEAPPTEAPPTEHPPTEAPPTEHPPTEAPPTEHPPTEHPPTEHPPTEHPPTEAPPTEAPPTEHPPTEAPPTEHPPTEAPPTEHPPTEAPPTEAPPTEHPPTEAPPTETPKPDTRRELRSKAAGPNDVIIGVASMIVTRCNTRVASGYTNVAQYINWIMTVTDDLS